MSRKPLDQTLSHSLALRAKGGAETLSSYRPFPRESDEFAPLSNAATTHPDSQLTL